MVITFCTIKRTINFKNESSNDMACKRTGCDAKSQTHNELGVLM